MVDWKESFQQLNERHWNLVGRGLQKAADQVEKDMEKYQELLECAVMRRDNPDRPIPRISKNPVPWRKEKTCKEMMKKRTIVAE